MKVYMKMIINKQRKIPSLQLTIDKSIIKTKCFRVTDDDVSLASISHKVEKFRTGLVE